MYKKQLKFRPAYWIFLLLGLIATLPVSALAGSGKPLILGIHPYLPAEEIKQRFTPLMQYLALKLDRPVQLRVSKNYETHIENMGHNQYDIAYFGPASYVELTEKYGLYPLLARLAIDGIPYFHGYIVTRTESSIHELSELKGKRFAFGSPHSTMSYLIPRHMMKQAGVEIEDLAGHKFLGNHRNVALGVLLGRFDAGAVKEEVYLKFKDKGLRQIAGSPQIPEHLFVANKKLPQDQVALLRDCLLNLANDPKADVVLTAIKKHLSALVSVNDDDYKTLHSLIK
jgi:phosphonate transport system substrate-binding protein